MKAVGLESEEAQVNVDEDVQILPYCLSLKGKKDPTNIENRWNCELSYNA